LINGLMIMDTWGSESATILMTMDIWGEYLFTTEIYGMKKLSEIQQFVFYWAKNAENWAFFGCFRPFFSFSLILFNLWAFCVFIILI
jgi:hypothetical protein